MEGGDESGKVLRAALRSARCGTLAAGLNAAEKKSVVGIPTSENVPRASRAGIFFCSAYEPIRPRRTPYLTIRLEADDMRRAEDWRAGPLLTCTECAQAGAIFCYLTQHPPSGKWMSGQAT
jgi:hypothetical protein